MIQPPPISALNLLLGGLKQKQGVRPELQKLLESSGVIQSGPIQKLLKDTAPGVNMPPAAVDRSARKQEEDFTNVDLNDIPGVLAKVYSDFEGDPAEKMVFIVGDGTMFVVKGGGNEINIPLGDVIRRLARRGKNLGDLVAIIHSHRRGLDFSPTDTELLKKLRAVGFQGRFQIFNPENRRLRTHKN